MAAREAQTSNTLPVGAEEERVDSEREELASQAREV